MNLVVNLISPANIGLDITSKLLGDCGEITRQVEEDTGKQTSGDVSLSLDDSAGYFSTYCGWAAGLDPQAYYGSVPNCWRLQVLKGGVCVWQGDLDVPSVTFEPKTKSVSATFLGMMARLDRYNAEDCRRTLGSTTIDAGDEAGTLYLSTSATPGSGLVAAYNAATVYAVGANVTYGGNQYKCKTACLNKTPGVAYSGVYYWDLSTEVRGKNRLYFWTTSARSTAMNIGTGTGQVPLQVGDVIRVNAMMVDGLPIQQDLEIKHVGPHTNAGTTDPLPTMAANEVRVKSTIRKCYTKGWVSNPWWKGLTVSAMAAKLFTLAGITTYNVAGANASMIIDEGDWAQKTVAQAFEEICAVASMILIPLPSGTWNLVGREATMTGAGSKDINAIVCESSVKALDDKWYDSVRVEGTAGWTRSKKTDGTNRYYRLGSVAHQRRELSIQTDLTGTMGTAPVGAVPGTGLVGMAYAAYNYWSIRRKAVEVEVLDDGYAYQLRDNITYTDPGAATAETWWVMGVSEPFRACDVMRDKVRLTLLQVTGIAASTPATGTTDDYFNEDPPYPPDSLSLGKGADDSANRPAWWADGWNGVGTGFRYVFPNTDGDWPLVKFFGTYKDDAGDVWALVGRLWVLRWKYTNVATGLPNDPPDGFEVTVYKTGKDPSNPTQTHGYKNPKPDADGWYYYPWYKILGVSGQAPHDKECVCQTWDSRTGLSAYSDYVGTSDTETAPTPMTVTISGPNYSEIGAMAAFTCNAANGAGSYSYKWVFGDGGYAYVRNISRSYGAVGTYTYYCQVTDASGVVVKSDTNTVQVYDPA